MASPTWDGLNAFAALSIVSGGGGGGGSSTTAGPVSPGTPATNSDLIGGVYNASPPSLTSGNQAALQLDAAANQKVNIAAGFGTLISTPLFLKMTDGTNVAAVKAASTAPLATDPAMVVSISPNSSIATTSSLTYNTSPPTLTNGQTTPLQGDVNGNHLVKVNVALPAGTNVIGKFTTDQTTHGTTDLVAADITKIAGALIATGHGTAAGAIRVELPTDGTGIVSLSDSTISGLQAPSTVTVQQSNAANLKCTITTNQTTHGTTDLVADDIIKVNGAAVNVGIGASGTGTLRVATTTDSPGGALANSAFHKVTDGTNVAGVKAASTAAVAGDPSLVVAHSPNSPTPAGTNLIGKVGIDQTTPGTTNAVQVLPGTTGGWTSNHLPVAASVNQTVLKASAGKVGGWSIINTNAAARYVKFYNKATTPVAGSDTPWFVICVPGGTTAQPSVVMGSNVQGIGFTTGIGFAITAGFLDSDATVVTSGDMICDILWA